MTRDQETPETKKPAVYALAKDKTYGERKFDFVFGTLTNFWLNLLVSAGFAFWVTHSQNTIKLPFIKKEFRPLRETQEKIGEWISRRGIMKSIKDDATRIERSHSMAGLLTLLTPGHFVLIPSVWLGDKIKPAFVKHFNRKHYGDEAMENPELIARHEAIEMTDKHALLGTLVGRLGTITATQLVSRTLGSPNNWANDLGETIGSSTLKKFGGVDPLAGRAGDLIGDDIERIAPKMTGKINNWFTRNNFTWSKTQLKNPLIDTSGPYNQSLQNFTRYVAQDVLYTLISSNSIHPVINFAKKFIPGMTYKSDPKPGTNRDNPVHIKIPAGPIPSEVDKLTDESLKSAAPSGRVSHINPQSTLHERPEPAVAYTG